MMQLPAVSERCRHWMIGALICAAAVSGCQYVPAASEEDIRWTQLFDDQSLTGWSQVNGDAPYEVVDGVIRGTNVLDSPNSFRIASTTSRFSLDDAIKTRTFLFITANFLFLGHQAKTT